MELDLIFKLSLDLKIFEFEFETIELKIRKIKFKPALGKPSQKKTNVTIGTSFFLKGRINQHLLIPHLGYRDIL
jgi:hypothetical protein